MSLVRGPYAAVGAAIVLACGARSAEPEPRPEWEFGASLFAYDVAASQDYVSPGFTADRGRLHLEVRYNYEALDTTSVWAGANFNTGASWAFDATVMAAVVSGDIDGVAPGFRIGLAHDWFEASSEGEYVVDANDHTQNFFYSWTEVTGAPTDWFRAGLAAQRTRAYETGLDVQRGIVLGFTYKSFDVAGYVFNVGWEKPTYVLAMSVSF